MVHGSENLLVEKASDGRKSNEQVGLHHLDRVDQTQTLEPGVVHGEAGEVVEQVLHLRQVLPALRDQPVLVDDVEPLVRLLLGQPVPPDNRVPDRQRQWGGGRLFDGSTKFFYENCCNSGTESRKIDPKVGN